MIDLSNQKWNFTSTASKVIKSLDDKGYDISIKKQFQTKDVFIVSKDGIETILEITNEMDSGMAKQIVLNFENRFNDLITIRELKEKLKAQGIDA